MAKQPEEILDIMRKIKENYQSQKTEVNVVKRLNEIELEGRMQDIYLVKQLLEKTINGESHVIEVDTYVTEKLEKIAGNTSNDTYQYPIVVEKYIHDRADIEEQIRNLAEEGLGDLGEMEKQRIKSIAKALKIREEQIIEIQELDLQQEIKQQNDNEKDDNSIKASKLNIKEETDLNQFIKGETLENKLELKEHGITDGVKLARVSSSSLNPHLKKATTQIDSFVVIKKDGTAVALDEDILEPDNRLGTNPTQSITTANIENGNMQKEKITSNWKICGRQNEYLSVGYDESYGSHREIKYTRASVGKKEYVSTELETRYTWRQDEDVRQDMNVGREGTRSANNMIENTKVEAREKSDTVPDKKIDIKDVDSNKNNNTHTHDIEQINAHEYIPYTKVTWREFANQCGYRGEGWLERTYEKWTLERNKAENANKDNEQLIEEIQQEAMEEYGPNLQR